MKRLKETGRVAAASVAACLLMGAGCPNGNLLDQLGNIVDQLPVDQQQLLDLVNQFFSGGAQQDASQILNDPNFAPADAQPAFGEDPSLYQASPDEVDFPEDPVFSAVGPPPGSAPPVHGRLVGRFWNDQPDSDSGSSPGVFRGQWFDANGQLGGYIRGRYRPAPADELPDGLAAGGVFRGRYVDLAGRFRGFIFGRYGRDADAEQGMFAGRWVGRDGQELGELRGRWIDDPQANGGTFGGRWAAFDVCNESGDLPLSNPNAQAAQDAGSDDLAADEAELEAFVDEVADPNDVPEADFPLDEIEDPELENPDRLPCVDLSGPHGVVRGVWESFDPNDPNVPNPNADGIMHGRWRDVNGGNTGRIVGLWAYDDASGSPDAAAQDAPELRGRFFAHVIDDNGELLGSIRGRFGRSPRGLGVFRGRMFDLFGNHVGGMRGRWIGNDQGDGHFIGIWNAPDVEDSPGGPGTPPPGDGGSSGSDSGGDSSGSESGSDAGGSTG